MSTMRVLLVVLPAPRQSLVSASAGDGSAGALEKPPTHASVAIVGSSLKAMRHGYERLAPIGTASPERVRYLLPIRRAGAGGAQRLSAQKLDAYLDRPPEATEATRLMRIEPPRALGADESLALALALRSGRQLPTMADVERCRGSDGVVILLCAPGLLGVFVAPPFVHPLFKLFPELHAPAPASAADPRDARSRNDELLTTLGSYKKRVLSGLGELARAVVRLGSGFPSVTWPATKHQELLHEVSRHVDRPLQIAFLGRFSTGKSSLINALVGSSLLPTSDLPTTATVHRISFGLQKKNVVRFKSEAALAQEIVQLAARADVRLPRQSDSTVPLHLSLDAARQALAAVCENIDRHGLREEDARQLVDTNLALSTGLDRVRGMLGRTETWTDEDLDKVLRGEGATIFTAEVHTYRDLPLLAAGVELVDLPGVDSMTISHAQIAESVVKEADLVTYVLNAQQPFNRFDHDTLKTLYSNRDPASVLLCANKIDLAGDPMEVLASIEQQHEAYFPHLRKPEVVPVSGRLGACARAQLHQEDLDGDDWAFYKTQGLSDYDLIDLSNILDFESLIGRRGTVMRGTVVVQEVRAALDHFVAAVELECRAQRTLWAHDKESQLSRIAELERLQSDFEQKRQVIRERLDVRGAQAAERVKAAINEQIRAQSQSLAGKYIEDYRAYENIFNAKQALNLLGGDLFGELRATILTQVTRHQHALLEELRSEMDGVMFEVRELADEVERRAWTIIFGQNWEKASMPPESRARREALAQAADASVLPKTIAQRIVLAVDPTGRFGETLLLQGIDGVARELTVQSQAVVESTVKEHCDRIEAVTNATIDFRLDEYRARVEGYRAQLAVLERDQGKWALALEDFERTCRFTRTTTRMIQWGESEP